MADRPINQTEIALLDRDAIEEIGRLARLAPTQLAGLIGAFEVIGKRFREIIMATPTNLKMGPADVSGNVRRKWLQDNVLMHLEQLSIALDRREMFASYPGQGPKELNELEWTSLRTGMAKLHVYVRSLQDDIEGRIADRSTVNAELRFDLVSQLADACRDAGIPIARPYVIGKTDKSIASQIIGVACKAITGGYFPIDHHLRDVIKLASAKKSH